MSRAHQPFPTDSAVATLDPPKAPNVGDTVHVFYDDPNRAQNPGGARLSRPAKVTLVHSPGEPDSDIDVLADGEIIDLHVCVPYGKALPRLNDWVLLESDGNVRRPYYNILRDELPPIGSTNVAVVRGVGRALEPVRGRVLAHRPNDRTRLVIAIPADPVKLKQVRSCEGDPRPGRWDWQPAAASVPLPPPEPEPPAAAPAPAAVAEPVHGFAERVRWLRREIGLPAAE